MINKFKTWDTKTKKMSKPFTLQEATRLHEPTDTTKNKIYLQSTGLNDDQGKEIFKKLNN